jgi:acid phosphatase
MSHRLRRAWVLAGVGLAALLAVTVAVASSGSKPKPMPKPAQVKATPNETQLQKVKHFVVIYEENHSFDNLYGGWEGVRGTGSADPAHTTQVDQSGIAFACLLQNDVNLTVPPLSPSCSPTSHFVNGRFLIDSYIAPSATTCPAPGVFAPNGVANGSGLPGGCTRDLVHRYYQEQFQLNGGHQNRYALGSDAAGLVMGIYDTSALPISKYLHQPAHPHYAIADDFFQGAFGGSFLNHQWLVAAAAPLWPNAVNDGGPNDLHSVVDTNGMPGNTPLYTSPAPSGTLGDRQLTASCSPGPGRGPTPPGVTCGDFAVNTTQPWYQPFAPGTPDARRLPPLTGPTIGSRLSAAGVDWAWYSGGWANANGDVGKPGWTNGSNGTSCTDPNTISGATYPNCADKLFQFHHQPLNYFAAYAPGTAARTAHLKDEQEFISAANASTASTCKLKPVSFIKPIGAENEHPGYTGETRGSDHLVKLLKAIEGSACGKDTMVIVTYDEFGGQWDHVPPPGQGGAPGPHDQWGPGTRVPALVVSPFLNGTFVVDHTEHDTTSILSTLEHRYHLQPVGTRDVAVPDLASVFSAKQAK